MSSASPGHADAADGADGARTNMRGVGGLAAAAKVAIWGFVAAVALGAAIKGAEVVTICAAGSLLLAVLPRAFTAVSGLRFPPGMSTGVLAYAAAALLLGEAWGVYVTLPWWDLALHVVAAAVLAQVGWALVLLLTGGARPATALWIGATLAFGFSMMVGGLWEMFEFTLDVVFGTNAQRSGLPDTMTDLIADAAGALWGAAAVNLRLAGATRLPGTALLVGWLTRNPIVYGAWPDWSAALQRDAEGHCGPLAAEDRALQRRR